TYTGNTFVNSGAWTLNTPGANGTTIVALRGDLTIDAGAIGTGPAFQGSVTLAAANQISSNSNVTINGGATLALSTFAQTLGSLTFNANGGGSPTVSGTGAVGAFVLSGNLSATSANVGNPGTLSAAMTLAAGVHDFTIAKI